MKKVKLSEIDWNKVNPATGPLFVEEAEPGGTLKIEVLNIKVENTAIMAVTPGAGILGDLKYESKIKLLKVEDNVVYFNDLKVDL